jgi:hypothetical protein
MAERNAYYHVLESCQKGDGDIAVCDITETEVPGTDVLEIPPEENTIIFYTVTSQSVSEIYVPRLVQYED